MRGTGQQPGAALADVVMVDQYDPKSSLQIPGIVMHFQPTLSREPPAPHHLHLSKLGPETLLAIESVWNLIDISQRDLLLIDRSQAGVVIDGVYLLNLPGFSLRAIFSRPGTSSRSSNRGPLSARSEGGKIILGRRRATKSIAANCSATAVT